MDALLWKRIGELFEAAHELEGQERLNYLRDQCGSDKNLLDKVLSLLYADTKSPPAEFPPTVTTLSIPDVVAGRFRIVRYIAEGGMGTVFEAEDLQLQERVALKTFRPGVLMDEQAIRRFKQEIHLGKIITHPSVCRLHDLVIDRTEDGAEVLYLSMEYLDGETLATRIARGPLPKAEALPLIEDMAEGLAAAHEAGVIHRDFKSGNVMLVKRASRTRAVITDFGLARTVHTSDFRSGVSMGGTVDYMAPEQIRGEELSPAADIYALGVVIYEMVTGRRPFTSESKITVAMKHLNDQPMPPCDYAPNLDANWNDTILRCLRKEPGERFQSTREVEDALPRQGYRFVSLLEPVPTSSSVVEQTPPEANTESKAAPPPKPRRRKYTLAVLVAFAFLVGLLYWFAAPNIAQLIRLHQLQQLTVVPLTALPGNVASPTFSPDGSQIAFAWDGENNGAGYDLYVKAIGTEKPLRLTHHPAPWLSASWSPDGRFIAISRVSGEDNTGIYLLPPTGGPERKLASRGNVRFRGNEISWSPDGKYLAYVDQPEHPKSVLSVWLFLLRVDTLNRTAVKTGCDTVFTPSYSPRGDYLAWVCRDTQAIFSVNAQRLSDGRTLRVAQIEDGIAGMAWAGDGSRILFSSESGSLWETSLDRLGDKQRLPFGYDALDISVSPASHRLAYVQGVTNTNIWRLDLQAAPPKASKLVVSSRQQIAPSISPDGSRIAFESDRTGFHEIWVCDADGSNAIQLSSFGTRVTGTPRWSADGKWIAFDSRAGGEANIYLVDRQGGVPRKLQIDIRGNNLPSWSHDGKWIYFTNGDDVSNESVWKVPSSGGHAVQVAQNPAFYPIESRDGQNVYFFRNRGLWRVRTDGVDEQAVRGMPELNSWGDKWFPFGSGIYFMSHFGGKSAIEYFDLKTEKVRRVYELEKPAPGWIGAMAVSSDGRWMLFPQMDEQSSNLMLIENWPY